MEDGEEQPGNISKKAKLRGENSPPTGGSEKAVVEKDEQTSDSQEKKPLLNSDSLMVSRSCVCLRMYSW